MAGERGPLGIELVRRGIVLPSDIEKALEYQKNHVGEKIGDILYKLKLGDPENILRAIGEILDEKTIFLTLDKVLVKVQDYMTVDMVREYRAVPFETSNGIVKVCFSSIIDNKYVENLRMLLLNKGLILERYITFDDCIQTVLQGLLEESNKIDIDQDVTTLVDSIIRDGMKKRASDIHIEPLENKVRIRFRIDGNLVEVAEIDKEKQAQIIGRLKSISNMHQEKQEPQDGRITLYPEYNIRSSSQKNIYGEKFVLRLLKKNQTIKGLFDLGFPRDPALIKHAFDKRNSVTIIAAPTGEGKTTTLYSAIDFLNKPNINITTIEDPVEIRIPGLNQVEIGSKTSFATSLRTVLRQDPNVILVGEIRDQETAEIAMQAGQTGHYVLTTIHTINAIETISRLRKMNIPNYDIASTIATSISQRLVRKLCPHCKKEREYTESEKEIITKLGERYNVSFQLDNMKTYEPVGCQECNNTGFYDRIAIYEILLITEKIQELIINNASTIEIREQAFKEGYKPLVIEGLRRVVEGVTSLEEVNNKLLFY